MTAMMITYCERWKLSTTEYHLFRSAKQHLMRINLLKDNTKVNCHFKSSSQYWFKNAPLKMMKLTVKEILTHWCYILSQSVYNKLCGTCLFWKLLLIADQANDQLTTMAHSVKVTLPISGSSRVTQHACSVLTSAISSVQNNNSMIYSIT